MLRSMMQMYVKGSSSAVEHYQKAFEATLSNEHKDENGNYIHAELNAFGQILAISEASHTITAYQPRKYMHPVIFLTFASEKKAPFVHETVHIIAWDWHTLWLKEGLAIFLKDKLGGYPSFPNFGKDIDKLARGNLRYSSITEKIGQDGITSFSNRAEREIFYIISGSFVKFIYENIGIENLMEILQEKEYIECC